MTFEEVSESMNAALLRLSPAELPSYLATRTFSPRPFTDFMRQKFREKEITQKEVFIRADLDDRYGYKLISGEKQTQQRDTVLRICLAAGFTLGETQEALILYGMAPLYARLARDAVLIAAVQHEMYDLEAVNRLLARCGQPPLVRDYA